MCWGSFLNVVAYRLITEISLIYPFSFCPQCTVSIAWYDNIPIISWIFLAGKCRNCKQPISYLYPAIELLTIALLYALYLFIPAYFNAYFIFFSALIVTIRSDLETMLISRWVTLFLIPLGFIFSWYNFLPISFFDSFFGAFGGYFFLYFIALIFYHITGKSGLGQGDIDLLSFIGSFIGIIGCWITILIASLSGSLCGVIYLFLCNNNKASVKIPFGPFLAIAAIISVFFNSTIFKLLVDNFSK